MQNTETFPPGRSNRPARRFSLVRLPQGNLADKANARKLKINFILAHKLDRACRNMRDAVRLQELEDTCGIKLSFVDNQCGPGAAGALSFNVMAAVAQYYSDNLRTEVLKGIEEKVRQGWAAGLAPYGYQNVQGNKEEPIQPHPVNAVAVQRIFELYGSGSYTFKDIAGVMEREGYTYQPSYPRFHRTAISYILNNRFYIGMVTFRGQTYAGKHKPIVDMETFERCQDLLKGKNRRVRDANHYLAGGVEKDVFTAKSTELKIEAERLRERLADAKVPGAEFGQKVLEAFEFAQNAAARWGFLERTPVGRFWAGRY